MRYLKLEEVLILHAYQIEKFGGNPNIRDIKLLESAIQRPQTSLAGKDAYTSVYEKAAVLAIGVIQNHPFVDGNKRTGLHAMMVFFELNEVILKITNKKLVDLGVDIANKKISIKKLADLLRKTSQHHS